MRPGQLMISFVAVVQLAVMPVWARAQLLPPEWQKAVLLLEREVKVDGQSQYLALGTGFLIGKQVAEQKRVFLITAKHVLAAMYGVDKTFTIRVDKKDGQFERIPIRLASSAREAPNALVGLPAQPGEQKWAAHKQYYVAAVDVSSVSVPDNLDYRVFDVNLLASKDTFNSLGLAPTDSVYLIVYDSDLNLRLVRSGMISALLTVGTFLVEARNLHGDSGSPVVLQPSLSRKPGVIQPTAAQIVGLVSQVYNRLEPIGKFGNSNRDLLFPQPMALSLVQPSYQILDLLSAMDQ